MKKILLGILCGIILATPLSSFAANVNSVLAQYIDFKFMVNGEMVVTQNAPVVIGGRSYLPVREVATLLGVSVDYDEGENMIIIGDKPTRKQYVIMKNGETINLYYTSMADYPLIIDEVAYGHLTNIVDYLGLHPNDVNWNESSKTAHIVFEGKEIIISESGIFLDGVIKSSSSVKMFGGRPLVEIVPFIESIGWQIQIIDNEIHITTP